VDVDLSEQWFDSVIVEREGHALSVMVQYEKQLSFCTQSNTMGHDAQTFSRLLSVNTSAGTSRPWLKTPLGATASFNGTKHVDSSKNQTQVVVVHDPTVTTVSAYARSANIGANASFNGTKPADSSKNQTQVVVVVHAPTVTTASTTVRSANIGANASFNGPRPAAPLKQLSSVTFAPTHDSKAPTSVKQPSALLHNNNKHGKPTFNKVDINLKK